MSILDSVNVQPTEPEIAAKQIIAQARQSFNGMVRSFNDGSRNFWNNPRGATPAEISAALGTDAKEVFELHYALGLLINSIKPIRVLRYTNLFFIVVFVLDYLRTGEKKWSFSFFGQ